MTANDIADIVHTLQCGIAAVKVVELAIDNDGGGQTYIDALECAVSMLNTAEFRLSDIVKEAISNENR